MKKILGAGLDFTNLDFERTMVEEAGMIFEAFPERDAATVARKLQGADGVITSYAQFPASVFEANPQLLVVSRTGTGVDGIDLKAATHNGTALCNVPDYGTEVVSDHAIALALGLLRRLADVDADIRQGIWDFARHRPLGQILGRSFGVVGLGAIGSAVARKAAGLGFRVRCWDRKLTPSTTTPEGYEVCELDDLLAQSDVVSFHVALTPDTHHLLNQDRLNLMKDDALIINTSRGAVIDTTALAATLQAGKLWGAGLDVFETEPLPPDSPLRSAPRTLFSSHDGYWSEESAVILRTQAVQQAIDVVQGRQAPHTLNPEAYAIRATLGSS